MPHQIMIDDTLYEDLTIIRDRLTSAKGAKSSYGDVLRLILALQNDIPSLIAPKFNEINKILLVYYGGDKELSHISISLQQVLIQGLRSEAANKNIQDDLIKVVENAIAINAVNPSAKKFEVK